MISFSITTVTCYRDVCAYWMLQNFSDLELDCTSPLPVTGPGYFHRALAFHHSNHQKPSFTKMWHHLQEDNTTSHVETGNYLRTVVYAVCLIDIAVFSSKMWTVSPNPCESTEVGAQQSFGNQRFNQWPWVSSFWNFPFASLLAFRCSKLKELEN